MKHIIGARYAANRAYWTTAFILAAYSIEFSFKQLILESVKYDKSRLNKAVNEVLNTHNLLDIYDILVSERIVNDIISHDLLKKYTNESQRYPSGKIEYFKKAIENGENTEPLLLPFFDSVFTKLDYCLCDKYKLIGNDVAFISARNGKCTNNYFAYNIHAYNYFERYISALDDPAVYYKNQTISLSNINKEELFDNEERDIKKNSEPRIPDLTANIQLYDDLTFELPHPR